MEDLIEISDKIINFITSKIGRIVNLYNSKVPKWLRFLLYYCTSIIWVPCLFIILICMFILMYPLSIAYKAWRDFDD